MSRLTGPARQPKPEPSLSPYEAAVIAKLDFLCEAQVHIQRKLTWAASCLFILALLAVLLLVVPTR